MATVRLIGIGLIGLVSCTPLVTPPELRAQGQSEVTSDSLHAGAAAIDITPTTSPSIIAGYFLEGTASQVNDRLYTRCIVLDDQSTRIALVIVDTCMMPRDLIDKAKYLASQQCHIAEDHIMVSATHTHSAPAAMGCLGTRQDAGYAAYLPGKIAEAIVAANSNRQPARIGWASVDAWEHTHNRRWIRKPEKMIVDPFGDATGRAHMHPGHLSPDVIGPSGPVDPGLSVLSVQTKAGQPLAVLANYSQHFYGAEPISADYFGLFSQLLASRMKQSGDGNGPFICAMSQGTSGDLMWMDYGSPATPPDIHRYAEALAAKVEQAMSQIAYRDRVPLKIVEKRLALKYRVPDASRLAWARPIASKIENNLPTNMQEVYAQEALILHERQSTEITLQAIRIGDVTISTFPNEVYALTGLKLKGRSPFANHFNIELANGAEGYIPPPEQHALGGYTTWPARTAGLEVEAEPKIVASLLDALEEATGHKRREMADEHGPYAQAVLAAQPSHYWRLNDAEGTAARNAVESASPAELRSGFAWYLPGVGSGTGWGMAATLTPSAFSGPHQINRAVHLAGGDIRTPIASLGSSWSIALWCWLGERSGASERSGSLMRLPHRMSLTVKQSADHQMQLQLADSLSAWKGMADDWHFVVLLSDGDEVRLHVDGATEPSITRRSLPQPEQEVLSFGEGLQGKLDEIAIFRRVLSAREISTLWQVSGIPEQRIQAELARKRRAVERGVLINPPHFAASYADEIDKLHPIDTHRLDVSPDHLQATGQVGFAPETYADFAGGRIAGQFPHQSEAFSVSLWFRCETPNDLQPVTAYFFSRGPNNDQQAAGDHWGIGGTYRPEFVGRLLFFNGNASDQAVTGTTVIPPNTWNHVVLIRDGRRVKAFLNGKSQPEIDADVEPTATGVQPFFLGSRNDHFAPLHGQLAHFALFDRALTPEEALRLHSAAGTPAETAQPALERPQASPHEPSTDSQ